MTDDLTDAETGIGDGPAVLTFMPQLHRGREPKLFSAEGSFALMPGENIVGRAADARVCLSSVEVSRHHARIIVSPDHVVVEDLGSKNGTFVRGHRIVTRVELCDGDAICIGKQWLTFTSAEKGNDCS